MAHMPQIYLENRNLEILKKYQLWCEGDERWTPGKIAKHYKISPGRVLQVVDEAAVRLNMAVPRRKKVHV
jgi:hypothetical protein